MEKLEERIKAVMNLHNYNNRTLAKDVDFTPASIGNYLSGRVMPGFDFIQNLVTKVGGFNTHWLITGKGSMTSSNFDLDIDEVASFVDQNHERLIKESALYRRVIESEVKDALLRKLSN
ncbi:hypothetical protein GCM10011414_13250 [Croceivirga lutea]|uniref:helix-turn-helix domain-containing protein n=1 Tax=Croceivirga lutea TaxID=1775167 RepID=UPI001639552D|nr:helix-turn-helix transcriptional regulator [Croceivirga lutea]GGG45050.1 hypothetical protein GCM10011414_13250 [Croceivirga lutea]